MSMAGVPELRGGVDLCAEARRAPIHEAQRLHQGLRFGGFKGFSKPIQVLFHGMEAVMVLTFRILK